MDSDQAINTKSNLNVDVLNDILSLIGIEPDAYLAKRPIINQRLVESRNAIAHGGRPDMLSDYQDLHDDVIQLIGWVRNDIENAAVTGNYRSNMTVPTH